MLKREGDPEACKYVEEGFDCLDHAYFNVELKNLLNMHKQTE